MSHPEGLPTGPAGPDDIAVALRDLNASLERLDVAGSVHNRLMGELGNTAGRQGRVVETLPEDPYLAFAWDSPAGEVTYRTPKDPRDEAVLPQVTIDRPSKRLGAQLMLAGGSLWFTPSRAEFTINAPAAAVETEDSGRVPEVIGSATSKLTGAQRPLGMTYNGLYWALRESGATISGPGPRLANGRSAGRLSSGH